MSKLDFYTRVHKKYVSLAVFYIIKTETLIYDHIAIMIMLRAQYRTLLSSFFTNQYFFLNSNPILNHYLIIYHGDNEIMIQYRVGIKKKILTCEKTR